MENQELKTRIENWIQSIDGKLITDESCEMLDHLIENGFFDEVKVTDLTSHLFEEDADEFEEWAKCHGLFVDDESKLGDLASERTLLAGDKRWADDHA